MEMAGGVDEGVRWRGVTQSTHFHSNLKDYVMYNIKKHSVIFIKCSYSLLNDNGKHYFRHYSETEILKKHQMWSPPSRSYNLAVEIK